MNWKLSDVQARFRKDKKNQRSNCQHPLDQRKSKEFQKSIYLCFIDYAKAFDCVDHKKCGKFLKRWEYQTTIPASWETCMQVMKQQLELNIEQWAGSKLVKEYVEAVYHHLVI